MTKKNKELTLAWYKVIHEKTVWQNLFIENMGFWYKCKNENIFLSSFKTEDLPKSPYPLTLLGKILTKFSTYANIMSRRPGTEEVTFYSLINEPIPTRFGAYFDRTMLEVAGTPIAWRRVEIERFMKEILKKYIFDYNETFAFIDIGSGGGFDSLEFERVLLELESIIGERVLPQPHDCVNIDIDSKWLKNNEILSSKLYGDKSRIKRINSCIFEYLEGKTYINELSHHSNAIISCNGFAEFLDDKELKHLYEGIFLMTAMFSGRVSVVIPFANRNENQEKTGNKIGFKYKAKDKDVMLKLIKDTFIGFEVTYRENHSQIVMIVER